MAISIRHLKQIMTIAKHGTFRGASKELHLTQPALTSSISKLEDNLGVKFFHRLSNGVELTDFGRHILQNAPAILNDISKLETELHLMAGAERGILNIGVGPVITHGVMRYVIPNFVSTYPGVRLNLNTGNSASLIADVEAGRLDLGIATNENIPQKTSVIFRELPSQDVVFVVRPDHPLISKGIIGKQSLTHFPLAVPNVPENIKRWFKNVSIGGTDSLQICLLADNYDLLIRTVLSSNAITFAPRHLLEPYILEKVLFEIKIAENDMKWQGTIFHNKVSTYSPIFNTFIQLVEGWVTDPNSARKDAIHNKN